MHVPQTSSGVLATTPAGHVDSVAGARREESIALQHVIATMKQMLMREDARLQREIQWLDDSDDDPGSYGSD